jgi:hypothetical protein
VEKKQPDLRNTPVQSAKRILIALLATYKKINFYSATHSVYLEALGPLHKLLIDHIEDFGDLRLMIERDRLLLEDTVIYEEKPKPSDLVFILHRDGMKWIEFKDGLERWEIDTLLRTFNDFCHLEADAEDDIVTVLWELKLPSINYETVDIELGLDDDIDFEALQCSPPAQAASTNAEKQSTPKSIRAELDAPQQVEMPEFERQDELFNLTPNERKHLKAIIAAEEKLDGSDYVVDVLLYIIAHHPLANDIDELIDDMTAAMQEALLSTRFSYLLDSLTKIKKQIEIFRSASHWSVPHLERFVSSLSSEAFLLDLIKITSQLERSAPDTLQDLKKFILLLDPEVIYPLAQIMVQSRSDKLQRFLLETITLAAKNDFRPMQKLLFASDRVLANQLIFILRFFTDDHSRKILFQLLHDESELIRKQALKALLARGEKPVEDIFVLIGDPDKTIRALLLKYLGRERNAKTEQLLLDYLVSNPTLKKDPDHFRAVCKTLGKCASNDSLPYLKKLLFKWPRFGVLRHVNSVLRDGANTALKELNTAEADHLIKRSHQGFFKIFFRSA